MTAQLDTPTALGRRLRAAREAKEWTQAELERRLLGHDELSNAGPRISRYESGMHKPDLDTIERLAKLLDLPAAYFVAKSDVVAEAILVISQLTPEEQKEALKLLKVFAKPRRAKK